jgi:hypothetical protein
VDENRKLHGRRKIIAEETATLKRRTVRGAQLRVRVRQLDAAVSDERFQCGDMIAGLTTYFGERGSECCEANMVGICPEHEVPTKRDF